MLSSLKDRILRTVANKRAKELCQAINKPKACSNKKNLDNPLCEQP